MQCKRLFSESLGAWVKVRITAYALRLVDKAGGIDRYLLSTSNSKLNPTVIKIKDRVDEAVQTKHLVELEQSLRAEQAAVKSE